MALREDLFPRQQLPVGRVVSREGIFGRLVFAAVGDSPELISGVQPQRFGSAARAAGRDGPGWASTSTSTDGVYYALPATHPIYTIGTDFTIFQIAQIDSWASFSALFCIPYANGTWTSPFGAIGLGKNSSSDQVRIWGAYGGSGLNYDNTNAIAVSAGGRYVIGAARYSGGARFLINGQFDETATGSNRTTAPDLSGKQPVCLLNRSNSNTGEGTSGSTPICLVFRGALSEAELRWLEINYRDVCGQQSVWIPTSAGGGSVSLTVADATHAHTADGLVLASSTALSVAEATHAHAADSATLVVGSVLTVAEASHAHTADSLTLTAASALAVADATHAHAADNVVLGITGATNLLVADATHGHTVDGLTLTAASVLAIQDALHAHAADNITLDASGAVNLLLADSLHAHTADGVALTVAAWLVVADAAHGHAADNVVLAFAAPDVDLDAPLFARSATAAARRVGAASPLATARRLGGGTINGPAAH